jgi:hypothetical protein
MADLLWTHGRFISVAGFRLIRDALIPLPTVPQLRRSSYRCLNVVSIGLVPIHPRLNAGKCPWRRHSGLAKLRVEMRKELRHGRNDSVRSQ